MKTLILMILLLPCVFAAQRAWVDVDSVLVTIRFDDGSNVSFPNINFTGYSLTIPYNYTVYYNTTIFQEYNNTVNNTVCYNYSYNYTYNKTFNNETFYNTTYFNNTYNYTINNNTCTGVDYERIRTYCEKTTSCPACPACPACPDPSIDTSGINSAIDRLNAVVQQQEPEVSTNSSLSGTFDDLMDNDYSLPIFFVIACVIGYFAYKYVKRRNQKTVYEDKETGLMREQPRKIEKPNFFEHYKNFEEPQYERQVKEPPRPQKQPSYLPKLDEERNESFERLYKERG